MILFAISVENNWSDLVAVAVAVAYSGSFFFFSFSRLLLAVFAQKTHDNVYMAWLNALFLTHFCFTILRFPCFCPAAAAVVAAAAAVFH